MTTGDDEPNKERVRRFILMRSPEKGIEMTIYYGYQPSSPFCRFGYLYDHTREETVAYPNARYEIINFPKSFTTRNHASLDEEVENLKKVYSNYP